jgi:ABC-type sugar transport system permease subunit
VRASAPAGPAPQERARGRTAPLRRSDRVAQKRSDWSGLGFVLPFLVAYGLFLIWPVIQGFRMSLFNWSLTGSGTDEFMGLGNYREALADPSFWSSLGNTALFTVLSTPRWS